MIDKLEFVLALAQERHFGRAAERCGVTQPTLSSGLRALEDSLGVVIVRRSSRFQGFTPEGERVLEWARRMVGDARAMRQDLGLLKRHLAGQIRLAVVPTALPAVARLTGPLRAAHPDVRFTVLSCPSARILDMLDNLEVDAGLTYLDNEPLGSVRTVPLFEERCCLLIRRDSPIGQRGRVSWSELGGLTLCLLTPDMQNRRIVDEALQRAGIASVPVLESNSTIVLVTHVRTGAWASILPEIIARSLGLPDTIAVLPIEEPAVAHAIGLVVPQRDLDSPLVAALLAAARGFSDEPQSPQ